VPHGRHASELPEQTGAVVFRARDTAVCGTLESAEARVSSPAVDGVQTALAVVVGCLLAAVLVVLLRRGRYRYCHMFAVYLGTQLLLNVTYLIAPSVFDSWNVWAIKESIYAGIRMALLVEIAMLVFRALPRARARAQLLFLITAGVLCVALLWPYDTHGVTRFALDLTGRFAYVTIWSLIGILMLVTWHRVPLHPLHKALLHGMLWLMVAHFATRYTVPHWGEAPASLLHNSIQFVVLGVWFRRVRLAEDALKPEEIAVVRYLQPWRAQ
jgi:hypothetical protein